ncbi:hypothetical protein ASE85_02490 [Sphingobium sp. Leaf26]|uniref:virion core protein, T7 gp14 family n=1 Tax=Sphingobium sp. Leaf26 TaxID=1735693 RepID=UPI0006F5A71C|nr:hypothetical protein [Sphingobium sp. Leaf26]KQN09822.1 hypothetical protein ASE85_02490 [Sphingobium sp. Leaf26]
MCEPTTLLIAATAISTLGAGYGALQANSQAKYQARVADQNAKLSAESARQETDNTRDAALQHYRKVAQLQGQQRVAMAAGGLDVDFGNAADLAADTDMLAREDARRIYDQGAENVRGFNIEGSNYRAQAAASRQAASGALIGGAFDMAGTALGGASQYSQLKMQMGGGRNSYGIKAGSIY